MAEEVITRAEARARGLKRYFTGNECLMGHVTHRLVSNFACIKCAKIKVLVWRSKNPQLVKAHQLKVREKNREKARLATQKWREADPERAKKSRNASNARNPEKHRNHAKLRKALVRGAIGTHTSEDLRQILAMQKNKCAHCRTKFTGGCKATLDHIIAIKNGGSNFRNNLQFLCGPCNSSKGSRDPIEFAQRAGRLI